MCHLGIASEAKRKLQSCQVPGCAADLSCEEKAAYCIKRRLCRRHMQADAVQRIGFGRTLWRYCFQCGKLEPLVRFLGSQRSCKNSLKHRRLAASARHSPNQSDSSISSSQCRGDRIPAGRNNSCCSTATSFTCNVKVSPPGNKQPRRRSFAELENELRRRSEQQLQQLQEPQQNLSSCFAQAQESVFNKQITGAAGPWLAGADPREASFSGSQIVSSSSLQLTAAAPRQMLLQQQGSVSQVQQLHAVSSGELNNASCNNFSSCADAEFCPAAAAAELALAFCGSCEGENDAASTGDCLWGVAGQSGGHKTNTDVTKCEQVFQQLMCSIQAPVQLATQGSSSAVAACEAPVQEAVCAAEPFETFMSDLELMTLIEQELVTAAAQCRRQQQQQQQAQVLVHAGANPDKNDHDGICYGISPAAMAVPQTSCLTAVGAANSQQWPLQPLAPAAMQAARPAMGAAQTIPASTPNAAHLQQQQQQQQQELLNLLRDAQAATPAVPAPLAVLPQTVRPEVQLLDDPCLNVLRARLHYLQHTSLQLQQMLNSVHHLESSLNGACHIGNNNNQAWPMRHWLQA